MNQRGFFQIFFILILIAGIGIVVYLIQFTQIFKPRANTAAYLQKITDAAFEPVYNPFGDPWGWKKQPNSFIPASIGIPSYHALGPKGTTNEIPEREIEFLSRSNTPILYMDSAVLQLDAHPATEDATKLDKLKDLLRRLKAKNIKVIGYTVTHEGIPLRSLMLQDSEPERGAERARLYESFLVHKKGVLPSQYAPENRVDATPDPSNPNKPPAPLFDITNPQYRAFIIPKMVEAMSSMELGGVLMDGTFYDALKSHGVQSPNIKVAGNEVPDEIAAAWSGAAAMFAQELKAAMGPDLLLFANIGRADVQYASNDLLRPGRLDGIMLEDPIGRSEQVAGSNNEVIPFVPGSSAYDNLQAMLKIAKERDKYVMVVVNTNVNCLPYSQDLINRLNLPDEPESNKVTREAAQAESRRWCHDKTSETWERRYAGYYLSAFLQQFQSPKQFMVYYTPTTVFYQFFSETFFKEWDLNIGNPLADVEPVPNAPGVFLRKFEQGYVYLNTNYNNHTLINSGNGIYSSADGTEINRGAIPAKSGRIFVTKAVLDSWNTPPPPPSPSQPGKPGDSDDDNDVDIFDYNTLVTDFGRANDPNTRADLDNDDDVDIFDYNILVTNFGR